MLLLLVLTGTAAAAGPRSLGSDGGLRSAAMLIATLQEAARQLANAEEAEQASPAPTLAARPRVVSLRPQTARHLSPPRPALCVLPPPAA